MPITTMVPSVPNYIGTPPSSADPANFDVRADYHVLYESQLGDALNPYALALNELSTEINAEAAAAAASAVLSGLEADRSELAADISVGAANYRGEYDPMVTYLTGQSVSYLGQRFIAKKTNLGITPVDGVDWLMLAKAGIDGIISNPIIENFRATRTFANGLGVIRQIIALDANREVVLTSSSHAYVYNKATNVLGNIATFRAIGANSTYAIAIDANSFLVASVATGGLFEIVVLSVSGETITVNAPTSLTIPNNPRIDQIEKVGTSFVLSFNLQALNEKVLYAATVSGTTVTVGSPLTLIGNSNISATLEAVSSSVVLALHTTNNIGYATPVSVSGTTLTQGTEATVTISGTGHHSFGVLSTGRYLVLYGNGGLAVLVSVSGTTATFSASVLTDRNVPSTVVIAHLKSVDTVVFAGGGLLAYRLRDVGGVINSATQQLQLAQPPLTQTQSSLVYASPNVGIQSFKLELVAGEIQYTVLDGVYSSIGTVETGFTRFKVYQSGLTLYKDNQFSRLNNLITSFYTDGSTVSFFAAMLPQLSIVSIQLDGTFGWAFYAPNPALPNNVEIVRYSL